MEVIDVVKMKDGTGETSYANSSFIQRQVLLMTRTVKEEAIKQMYNSISPTKALCLADLGCACGPNTLTTTAQLITSICKLHWKSDCRPLEFQVFLNDLPGNDFNSVFRSLKSFQKIVKEEIGEESDDFGKYSCFFNGVPGSFYGRLFPPQTLHFVHSSYSLMWLSQVPRGLESNKGNIYMTKTSPFSVLQAYYEQFQRDFSTFLMCRSKEMVVGGFMVLTILGRRTCDPTSESCCFIWDSFARVLRELVVEGIVEEGKLNTFNIPNYYPSTTEIEYEVEKEGSFTIHKIDISEMSWWNENGKKNDSLGHINNVYHDRYDFAKCMWSVAHPLLASHFGEDIMDKLFIRFKEIIKDCENKTFINVTVSMMKKGASTRQFPISMKKREHKRHNSKFSTHC